MEVTQANRVSVHRRIVERRQAGPGAWRIGKNPTCGVLESKAFGSGDARDGCNRTKARRIDRKCGCSPPSCACATDGHGIPPFILANVAGKPFKVRLVCFRQ
jgi:hypothetical protein